MKIRENYNHTIYASYIGYITQAIVNNLAPLLFLTFSRQFDLTLDRITVITTLNFAVQLVVDLISAKVVDRIGYRVCIVAAHIFSAAGLVGLAALPWLLPETADPPAETSAFSAFSITALASLTGMHMPMDSTVALEEYRLPVYFSVGIPTS